MGYLVALGSLVNENLYLFENRQNVMFLAGKYVKLDSSICTCISVNAIWGDFPNLV